MSIRFGTACATAVLTLAPIGSAVPAHAAAPAVTCDTNIWKVSYYANTTFKGDPRKTACDKTINEDYGTSDPAGVCDRITGYNVYDYDYEAGVYVKLNDAPLPTVPSSWTDTTTATGTTHVYRVTAVLDDGTESFPIQGSIALAPSE